jgi:pSer/pThr/pTyr-binding forkhead associated (FHA) protein
MSEQLILQGLGASHVLEAEQTVGRSSECRIALTDLTVSRKHARITIDRDRVTIHDLRSQNGTYINGVRITKSELQIGGTVVFGNYAMQLCRGSEHGNVDLRTDASTRRIIREDGPPTHLLSPAEMRVLQTFLEEDEMTEKEAAARLNLSVHTVHNHIRAIYRRLGVTSRAALLKRLLRDSGTNEAVARDPLEDDTGTDESRTVQE